MSGNKNISYKCLDNIYVNFIDGSYIDLHENNLNTVHSEYNKFILPVKGNGYIIINKKRYELTPGNIYLICAKSNYSFENINCAVYQLDFIAKVENINLFNIIYPEFCLNTNNNSKILNLFKELIELKNKGENVYNTIASKGILLQIISFYLKLDNCLNEFSNKKNDFRNILYYIEQNIEKKLSVNELADVMHLHPNYFIRYFKSFFGTPPIKFINNMRMEKAKHLISEGKLSISEIAKSVGFDDTFYFSKQFKKYNGFAPTEYKTKK